MKRLFFILFLLLPYAFGLAQANKDGYVQFTIPVKVGEKTVDMGACIFPENKWGIRIGCLNNQDSAIPPDSEGYVELPDSATAPDGRLLPVCWFADNAFHDCRGITGIHMPKSVLYYSVNTFKNCSGLREFTIPENVDFIFPHAFYGCDNLQRIYLKPENPPTSYIEGTFSARTCQIATLVMDMRSAKAYLGNILCSGFHYHAELVPAYSPKSKELK